MHVTIVVGEREREVRPAEGPRWARPRFDDVKSLAADEQGLLDELTRLCQDILLVEEWAVPEEQATD